MGKLQLWETLSTRELIKSKWLSVRKDVCRLPSGREMNDYFVVEVPNGAAIVAVTEANELVLVRQYKYGFGDVVLELPAGIVEVDEKALDAISRELWEEIGYRASKLEYVTTLVTKPARMSARTIVYFATGVTKDSQTQENDAEVIETVLVPIADLPALIQRGDIITETSLAALMMVWNRLFM